jgi:hypothetical protein
MDLSTVITGTSWLEFSHPFRFDSIIPAICSAQQQHWARSFFNSRVCFYSVCSILQTAFRGNLKCRAAWICAAWENVQVAKTSNKVLGALCWHTSLPTQLCALPASQRLPVKMFSRVMEGTTKGKVLLATQRYEEQEGNKTKKNIIFTNSI